MTLQKINPTPCALFLSAFFRADLLDCEQLKKFVEKWALDWPGVSAQTKTFVTYYKKEMGESESYQRLFFFSQKLFDREVLLDFKDACIDFEMNHSTNSLRSINLDPGILCLEHFILATTKPYAHRPLLGRSIYAELVYLFEKGNYHPLPWAYPDYVDSEVIALFKKERERLLFNSRK